MQSNSSFETRKHSTMSHNSKFYVKKLNSKTAQSCKKIDVLFKQDSLSKKPKLDESVRPPVCENSTGNENSGTLLTTSEIECENQMHNLSHQFLNKHPSVHRSRSSCESDSEPESSVLVPDARQFTSAKYESRFTWLYYSAAKSAYFCKICELFSIDTKEGSFACGVRSLGTHPTRKLVKHDSSKEHNKSLKKQSLSHSKDETGSSILSLMKTAAERKKTADIERNKKYISILISTIYFVIRQRWALDSVSDVMNHMASMGNSDIISYLEANPQRKYTSSKSVTEIISCIDRHIEKEVLDKVKRSKVYALLADESSDEAHREQFAIIVKVKDENGSIEEHFLGIVEVKKQTAENLMEAIENFLLAKGIEIRKAFFVGFDGCNTMSGENKGLQRRFRHVVPHQIYINCRNHKLALCVKHLIKDFPSIEDVDTILLSIWKLFHYSPRNHAIFQAIQENYGLRKLKFIKASTTRWLSHGRSCLRLVERFEQVIDAIDGSLDDKYVPEVFGLRTQLLEKRTVAMILVLCDVLKPVIYFSEYLQSENIVFSDMQIKCGELIDQLHHLIARFDEAIEGRDADLQLSKMERLFQIVDDRTALARRLRAPDVSQRQMVEELAKPVTYSLINEISDAFRCSPVLSAFSIFNMKKVPETIMDLQRFGEEEIQTLASHYGRPKEDTFQGHRTLAEPFFSEAEIRAQFSGFKHQLCLNKQKGCTDTALIFKDDDVMTRSYPAMDHLVTLSAILPTSTACVERLFSLMNSLCTPSRSTLGQNKLEALIRINCSLKQRLLETDIESIIELFKENERDIAL